MARNNSVIQEEDGYDECPECLRPIMPGVEICPFCKTIITYEFSAED